MVDNITYKTKYKMIYNMWQTTALKKNNTVARGAAGWTGWGGAAAIAAATMVFYS